MRNSRVVVFVDYQNVFSTARQCFGSRPQSPADGQVDPLALASLLASRRNEPSALSHVRVYRGLPDATRDPRTHGASQRQADRWSRSPRVHLVTRPLRYPRGWPEVRAQEKGIDVALAIDVVRLAIQDAYDIAVVMSTDTDLLPALEAVIDLDVRAGVEVAAWSARRANRRLSVGGELPWCHYLSRDDYVAVHDPTDYSSVSVSEPGR